MLPFMFPAATQLAGRASIAEKFRDAAGIRSVLMMTAFHEMIVTPFEIFPAFYFFNNLCSESTHISDVVPKSLSTYKTNFWEDNKVSMMIFLPSNLFNFFVMP